MVTALVAPVPGVEDHLTVGAPVWAVDAPLVVFCAAEQAPAVTATRRRAAPGATTVVVPLDVAAIRAADDGHDSPESLELGRQKPALLARAAALVTVDALWWIDVGIAQVAEVPSDLTDRLADPALLPPAAPLHVVELSGAASLGGERWARAVTEAAAATDAWWRNATPLVAGGVLGVRTDAVEVFAERFAAVRDEAVRGGHAATGEMILSVVAARDRRATVSTSAPSATLLTRLGDPPPPPVLVRDVAGVRAVSLPGPDRPDRAAFNPSIARDPAGGFRVAVRHANYRYERGAYRSFDSDGHIRTENVLLELDDDLVVRSSQPVDDRVARATTPTGMVHGLEDLRLFRQGGRWFGTATVREHDPSMLCRIVLVELDDATITGAWLLPGPRPGAHEKNWMPFDDDDRFRFAWRAEPPVIITLDGVTGATTLSRPLPVGLDAQRGRGGSPFVRVDDGWLGVVHDVGDVGGLTDAPRVYRHRFVLLDADREPVGASVPFSFEAVGIEFCAGLATAADHVVCSYGVDDAAARLAVVPWSVVGDLLGRRVGPQPAC